MIELFQKYYPGIINRTFILGAPMFFEDVWDEINEAVGNDSSHINNFVISNKTSHTELSNQVKSKHLPKIYGGETKFDLSKGLYNEVGPWSAETELILIGDEENKFEYNDSGDSDEAIDDDIKTAIQGIPSFLGGGMLKKNNTKFMPTDGAQFNLEALGELINQTPNATPMNTYADDED